jgi:hypothetical protein
MTKTLKCKVKWPMIWSGLKRLSIDMIVSDRIFISSKIPMRKIRLPRIDFRAMNSMKIDLKWYRPKKKFNSFNNLPNRNKPKYNKQNNPKNSNHKLAKFSNPPNPYNPPKTPRHPNRCSKPPPQNPTLPNRSKQSTSTWMKSARKSSVLKMSHFQSPPIMNSNRISQPPSLPMMKNSSLIDCFISV